MAIDSSAKRWSMLAFGQPQPSALALFEVDGAVDADDRATLLGLYGGLMDAGVPTPVADPVRIQGRRYKRWPWGKTWR